MQAPHQMVRISPGNQSEPDRQGAALSADITGVSAEAEGSVRKAIQALA
jgi:hypothetical protein